MWMLGVLLAGADPQQWTITRFLRDPIAEYDDKGNMVDKVPAPKPPLAVQHALPDGHLKVVMPGGRTAYLRGSDVLTSGGPTTCVKVPPSSHSPTVHEAMGQVGIQSGMSTDSVACNR